MAKSWWMSLKTTPRQPENFIACVELPGGEDDAGLMESDLTVLFNALIQNAHPDLTEEEIRECFDQAFGEVSVLEHCIKVEK